MMRLFRHNPNPLYQVKGIPFNVVADHLSHKRTAEAACVARRIFGVSLFFKDPAWMR